MQGAPPPTTRNVPPPPPRLQVVHPQPEAPGRNQEERPVGQDRRDSQAPAGHFAQGGGQGASAPQAPPGAHPLFPQENPGPPQERLGPPQEGLGPPQEGLEPPQQGLEPLAHRAEGWRAKPLEAERHPDVEGPLEQQRSRYCPPAHGLGHPHPQTQVQYPQSLRPPLRCKGGP